MTSPPGRDTRPADSDRRWTWYGHGRRAAVEKDGLGRLLDDVAYAFADVFLPSVPVLLLVAATPRSRVTGLTGAALVAWLGMAAGVAVLRGGWVRPLGTPVRGWVSLAPALLVARVAYYNALLAAAIAGDLLARALLPTAPSPVVALAVGLVGIASFPWLAELLCRRLAD